MGSETRSMYVACTRDCYDTCVFEAVGGSIRPASLFPTLGFTCPRGVADLRRADSPRRVLKPYVAVEEGKFREVSWREAVRVVVERLRESLEARGPQSVLHVDYDGNQGLLTWDFPIRLWNALRAASTDYSICSSEGKKAIALHYGTARGAFPRDMERFRAAVFWAVNAATSFIHGWGIARRRGMRIAAVDIAMTRTLKHADVPIVVRPGTDAALALGIARELIVRGSVDMDFVGRYTVGYEKFRAHVERFTPEYVCRVTGLSRGEFMRLVDFYEEYRPLTVIGFAIGRTLNGGDAARAISLIPALLGIHRGFYYSNTEGLGIDTAYLRGLHASGPSRIIGMGSLGEELRRGSLDFIYVWNSNPLVTLPGGNELRRRGSAFLVVHDPFWSDTALVADVVLPAPLYLEKEDVVYSYWHNLLTYNRPVRQPPGESRSEVWVMGKIAEALGLKHPLIEEDPWRAVDVAIGGRLAELRERGVMELETPPHDRYETPSGKIEFYSTLAESKGHPPLPRFVEPPGGTVLVFTSEPLHTNSQFAETYGPVPPAVRLSPADADGLGLGEVAVMEGSRGKVKVKVVRDPDVPPGIALMEGIPKDLDGVPINAVVNGEGGPYGGTPRINYTQVRLSPA